MFDKLASRLGLTELGGKFAEIQENWDLGLDDVFKLWAGGQGLKSIFEVL